MYCRGGIESQCEQTCSRRLLGALENPCRKNSSHAIDGARSRKGDEADDRMDGNLRVGRDGMNYMQGNASELVVNMDEACRGGTNTSPRAGR